jgi:hypothetical protein
MLVFQPHVYALRYNQTFLHLNRVNRIDRVRVDRVRVDRVRVGIDRVKVNHPHFP